TAFASYLPDPASIPALRNASLLFGLPVTLVAQVVGQALLPHITAHATRNRYVRMSQTVLKSVSACVLLSIPAAIVLSVGGYPAIRLLFQHGAFDPHASTLTARALLGYAVGLPGLTASGLLILSFYALKDARTPLLTNIGTFVARISLLLLLLRVFRGDTAM